MLLASMKKQVAWKPPNGEKSSKQAPHIAFFPRGGGAPTPPPEGGAQAHTVQVTTILIILRQVHMSITLKATMQHNKYGIISILESLQVHPVPPPPQNLRSNYKKDLRCKLKAEYQHFLVQKYILIDVCSPKTV